MDFSNKYFVFYDTETTGLSTQFSQIIQAGCLLTDFNFKVIEELNLSSKVLPWIVPSPEAFLTHKQTACLNEGPSHYEMMTELRNKWMEWGADKELVFVSYNGHKFDEELIRRQLYWNLYDPYITNTNGNTRLDLMSLFQIIGNFYSDLITMPEDENNQVSLKLTDLSSINNISTKDAHDAIVDCNLMIELMKIIKDKAPEALKASIIGSSKNGNISLVRSEPFCMLGEIYRKKKGIYPVIACGQNPNQANQVALADLYFDPNILFEMNDHELLEQFGPGGAIKIISINKSVPLIGAKNLNNIDKFLDSPIEVFSKRAKLILENIEFQDRISELQASSQKTYGENKYLEQMIYERFPSNNDKLWMERFEISPWAEKAKLSSGFEDERYRKLSERLVSYAKPEFSSNKMQDEYHNFVNERLFTNGPWKMTLEKAISRSEILLNEAKENKDKESIKILNDLINHYQEKRDFV